MDAKSDRRNFYEAKTFFATKYDKEYTTEKFPEQLQYMLDDYIPNATMKQLKKFMSRKYERVLKSFPEVEKALNKVLKTKFNSIISDMRKNQIKKILSFVQDGYDSLELVKIKQNQYELTPKKAEKHVDVWNTYTVEGITIRLPNYALFEVDTTEKEEKGFIKFKCLNPKNNVERRFVSAEKIETEKFTIPKVNFQRQANAFLEKLNQLNEQIKTIEGLEQ